MTEARARRLLASWRDMGQYQTLAVGPNGEVYDGHQRVKALVAAGYAPDYEVRVLRTSRPLTEEERERLIIESTVGTVGMLDWDALAGWDTARLIDWGLDHEQLAGWRDATANLQEMIEAEQMPALELEEEPEREGGDTKQYRCPKCGFVFSVEEP